MEITVDPTFLWNFFITVVLVPLGFLVRSVLSEQKRIDILLNKTREEIAKDYVTREQIEADFQRLMNTIERIDEKIDRLQSRTYFQD
jgi:division protein CdvB (Snf7/Vps24/ESCRT-III family)